MKKFASLILIVTLCLTLIPGTANAAITRYIVKSGLEYTIIIGEKITLYTNTSKSVTWSSSNKKVASVSKKGVVLGKTEGTVKIIEKIGKIKYSCTIIVLDGEKLREKSESYSPDFEQDEIPEDIVFNDSNTKKKDVKAAEDEKKLNERINEILQSGGSTSTDGTTKDTSGVTKNTASTTKDNEKVELSELDKEYNSFCETWISEELLKKEYNISATLGIYTIYLINNNNDSRYMIENAPLNLTPGVIYIGSEIQYQYIKQFEFKGETKSMDSMYFNKADLISKGIIQ